MLLTDKYDAVLAGSVNYIRSHVTQINKSMRTVYYNKILIHRALSRYLVNLLSNILRISSIFFYNTFGSQE